MATQSPPEPTAALLTLSEVAELAKVSRSTVRREISRGELRAVHIGRHLRVHPDESPESRLYAAGFTRRLEFWCPPGEDRALGLDAAIALLDAGEVEPARLPSWPGIHPDALVGFQPPSEDEIDRRLHPPPPTEPPPLPEWAAPWAELLAEQLKPIIRSEIRSALRAEARKAREPKT